MKPRKNWSAVVRAALPGSLALVLVALSMGGCDLSSLLPSGSNNPPPTQTVPPPQPVFTSPASNLTVPAGKPVDISWTATSQQKTVVSQLYYDQNGVRNSGDEVLLTQASKAAKDYSVNMYHWDTTGLAPGTYHLLVVASDGENTPVTLYANYTVTVVDSTPTITVTEPAAPVSVDPAQNVVVKWTQSAPLGSSTVTLYYDDDSKRANGYIDQIATLSQPASSTGGSHVWNVLGVAAGQYYVLAELDYGTGTVFSYSAALVTVAPPTVKVFAPAAPVTFHGGGNLSIEYQVTGVKTDGSATISLFREDSLGARVLLMNQPITSTARRSWLWPASPFHDTYRILAVVDDGINDPDLVTAYAPGSVTDVGPVFSVTSPSAPVSVGISNPLPIGFTYAFSAGSATVDFYLDTDNNFSNGYITPALGQTQAPAGRTSGTFGVTIPTTVAPGDYYLLGIFDDGNSTVIEDYAGGLLTVTVPQIMLTQPAVTAEVFIGDQVTIAWSGNIPAGNPSMKLFYSPTQNLADPGLQTIQDNINPNTSPQSLVWTVPNDANLIDKVYIGATVTTTLGPAVTLWAPVLTIPLVADSERHLGTMTNYPDNAPNDPTSPILVFQGFSANGQLGKTIAGGNLYFSGAEVTSDANGDGIPDLVIAAPTGRSLMLGGTTPYGEAYLIYGQRNPRRAGQKVQVSSLPATAWPGAVFPGVDFSGTSDGIASISFLPDLDGDGKLDLLFGLPDVKGINHEDQDYDPIDQDKWDRPPPDQTPPAQSDTYQQLTQLFPGAPDQPNPDDFDFWGGSFSTGMAIFAASSVATTGFDNKVIPLGDVGQFSKNALPRAVKGFGMRVYPRSLFLGGTTSDASKWGKSVSVADLDADGIADWLISSPVGGYVQIIFGRTYSGGFNPAALPSYPGAGNSMHALSYPYVRQDPPAGTPTDRDFEVPWVYRNISGEDSSFDKPVDIGDFNNDGRDDVACVAPAFSGGKGAAYIIFGHPTIGNISVTDITNDDKSVQGLKLAGDTAGQKLGTSHARFGDLNGDGFDDYAIGVPGYTGLGRNNCGAVVVVFGGANVHGTWTLANVGDPATGKTVPGVIIVGGKANDAAGTYVATAGDVDGDGYLDMLVAAPRHNYVDSPADIRGAVYLIYGGPALRPRNDVIDLTQVGRTVRGKVYIGPTDYSADPNAATIEGIGPVSAAGDVDGDGKADFLIGNFNADPRNIIKAGECYLIYGSDRKAP